MQNKISLENINIGDKVILSDNTEGIVIEIRSVEFLNYIEETKDMSPCEIINKEFLLNKDRKLHKIYNTVTVFSSGKIIGTDICCIKKLIKQEKKKKRFIFF